MLRIIAGPCVIEDEKTTFEIARSILNVVSEYNIDFYFKGSFDKANRSSINSFRGVGFKKGLSILKKIKEELGVKIITDVHETWQIKEASKVCDGLQIPAFLSRQTDLLEAVAKSGKFVNIKKMQMMDTTDCICISEKMDFFGCNNYQICERGISFGYGKLAVDFKELSRMVLLNKFVVAFDATHCTQYRNGKTTSGESYLSYPLSVAAASIGINSFFFEVHTNPSSSLSDKDSILDVSEFKKIVKELIRISEFNYGRH